MTTPPEHRSVSIPPPGTVRIAAWIVVLEAAGLVAFAISTLVSGISNQARMTQLVAEVVYFVVLALALALVCSGLLRGRRWARTPAAVAQAVVIAIGMWMAFPSEQLRWGLALIVVGGAALALLVTPAANHWIRRFPPPFGIGQDR